jgi:MEDS: MEthanogen/methylotroph, DcmR Sensory domain
MLPAWPSNARHGGHLCLPFETDDEKLSAVLAFVHEGLSRGARCMFVGTPDEYQDLREALDATGLCAQRAQARGALVFATTEETYLEGGVFDPQRSIQRLGSLIGDAISDGFTGFCGTAELSTVPDDREWRKLISYEAQVNEHFSRSPFSGLCRYPQSAVHPERVQDVLRTHPVALVRGELCENPFYERPELALSGDNRTRVDWQLRQLRVQQRARQHLEETTRSAVNAAAELAAELNELRSRLRSQAAPPRERSED